MDFKTFDRCMLVIRTWRSKKGKEDYDWPDSRDPDLREVLTEFGVVPQDLEKSMIALAAWREADSDLYLNMSTIVHVIKNRQNKALFRTHLTWSELDQFPGMTTDKTKFDSYPTETENFKKLLDNLDSILENKTVDITQGALYFGHVGDMPDWFRTITESTNYERTVQVDRYTFYKERKK